MLNYGHALHNKSFEVRKLRTPKLGRYALKDRMAEMENEA